MKRILLISGKQGSGKSSNVSEICRVTGELGYIPFVIRFADPIYEIQSACEHVLKRYKLWPTTELNGASMWAVKDGDFLQVIGTEYGRERRGEDAWIRVCRERVDAWLEKDERHLAVIDDCRFENEFDAFPDAYRVRLEAPRDLRKSRVSYWRDNENHPSETGLDEVVKRGEFDLRISTETARIEVTAHAIRIAWFNDEHCVPRKEE